MPSAAVSSADVFVRYTDAGFRQPLMRTDGVGRR
jgi:hypothetical protein